MPLVWDNFEDLFGGHDPIPNPLLNAFIYLPNGKPMPVIGITSWHNDKDVPKKIQEAIQKGFRQVEVSTVYNNEKLIGKGIRKAIKNKYVKREDLFVVLKIWLHDIELGQMRKAVKKSLQKLGLDHVDMVIAHAGAAFNNFSDDEIKSIWLQMHEIYKSGNAKSIGVANWFASQISSVLRMGLTTVHLSQKELELYYKCTGHVNWCEKHFIPCSKYATLGCADKMNCTLLTGFADLDFPIGHKHNVEFYAHQQKMTPDHITVLHALENGFIAAPPNVPQSQLSKKYIVQLQMPSSEQKLDLVSISNYDNEFVAKVSE